jgi:hypothetical protein
VRNRVLLPAGLLAASALSTIANGCAQARSSQATLDAPDSYYGNDRLARELRPAAEKPLATVEVVDDQPVYRMVTLGAWGGAGIIRVQRHGATWQLVSKATNNETRRQIVHADSATITAGQVDSLIAIIARSRYWTQPAQTCLMGLDGYRVVLEARVGSEYFMINCWVPEERTAPAVVATMRAFEALSRAALGRPASERR